MRMSEVSRGRFATLPGELVASFGGVAEWLNAAVSKTVSGVKPLTRVRIPPPPLTGPPVIGVDWYKAGWVAVVLGAAEPEVMVGSDLEALIGRVQGVACVGVDMPIGPPETGPREADLRARAFVGSRRNSVFMAPVRAVLDAPSYAEANVIAAGLLDGKKISRQAGALRTNIAAVGGV